jgi:hypothetical protein
VSAIFRGVNWLMCALFLLSVLVQWNDPDPVRWMAIYGAALAVCLAVALRARVPAAAPMLVGFVALAWAVATIGGGRASGYSHMFDTWEMKSPNVEEAREATGLLIVGVWMLVSMVAQRSSAGKRI